MPENGENKISEIKEKTDTIIPIERTQHGECKHVCEKSLFCGHICKQYCHHHEENECPPCEDKCTVLCKHTTCNKSCL
jgi:hypothetical protein